MPIVTLSERGQLVIPQEFREKLALRRGSKLFLEFSEREKTLTLRPLGEEPKGRLRGILKGTRVLEMLEAEHKKEIAHDERRAQRHARRRRG